MQTTIRDWVVRRWPVALGLLLSVGTVSAARAQDVEVVPVTFLEGLRTFRIGEHLDLKIKLPSASWLGINYACAFRATDAYDAQAYGVLDDCVVYDAICTRLYDLPSGVGLPITVNRTWLQPVGDNGLTDQTYVLVFLRGSLLTQITRAPHYHEWVRIRKGEEARYFQWVYRMKVEAPAVDLVETRATLGVMASLTNSRATAFPQSTDGTHANATAQTVECLHLVEAEENGVKVAYLRPCDRNDS
jgi:hypothetical protein